MNRVASLLFNARRILKRTQLEGPLPDDGDLLRRAFRVAWPSTLESFLVALVSVVDTIMVSSLGAAAIAAIGLTGQPKFICLAVFLSVNVAVSAIVARRKGVRRPRRRKPCSGTGNFDHSGAYCRYHRSSAHFSQSRCFGSREPTRTRTSLPRVIFASLWAASFYNVLNMVINAAQRGVGNTKIAMRPILFQIL